MLVAIAASALARVSSPAAYMLHFCLTHGVVLDSVLAVLLASHPIQTASALDFILALLLLTC